MTVVKNIPENNQRLWKVKHLIKMEAITFPYGEPTANDLDHTYLRENGECLVVKEIGDAPSLCKRIKEAAKLKKAQNMLDGATLRRDSRLKWLNPW